MSLKGLLGTCLRPLQTMCTRRDVIVTIHYTLCLQKEDPFRNNLKLYEL